MNQPVGLKGCVKSYNSNDFRIPRSKLFARSRGCENLPDVRATTELDSDNVNVKTAWQTDTDDLPGFSLARWHGKTSSLLL